MPIAGLLPWPKSLFSRLMVILLLGLVTAHLLSFGWIMAERSKAARAMMVYYLAKDVASSVAILERLPGAERPDWLGRLERENYRYVIGPASDAMPATTPLAQKLTALVGSTLGAGYIVTATTPAGKNMAPQLDLHVQLSDGTPLTIELVPSNMPVSLWIPVMLTIQLAILAAFTWFAVRLATRPLAQLARAADLLNPEASSDPLPESGPSEVARAATAFNAMQRRIAVYLAERLQILAAVSHDLQTPITRMQLRADLMDNGAQRDKMLSDLSAMQILVEQGLAYARNGHGLTENPCRTDLDALLESLVYDYQDAGQHIRLDSLLGHPVTVRPHALRRIIANLVDNSLKFGKDVEILVSAELPDRIAIAVLDRGPGIEEAQLERVFEPFYRLEGSRNRETGGTGLGLAIAQQLTIALGGVLTLTNRDGGGLHARVSIPAGS